MKKNLLYVISTAVFSLLVSGFVFAQNDRVVSPTSDIYVISAKAGVVSFVEGKVSVIRKDGKSGYLIKDDSLQIGDKVSTGTDGKAEILLNPGSYLRLGANSGFEFVTTDLDDLKLKLTRGSAILEVVAADEFKVSVSLPNADLTLTRSGVFRIDVLANGNGKISVWKGKVFVGTQIAEVKSGKSAIVVGKIASVAKFDRDNADEFDIWSKFRAKELAQTNARLQRDLLRNSLLNTFNQGSWNVYNSFGLWVFDPVRRRWCFLPFGSGWGSPYGFDYGFNMWYIRLPYYVYTYPTTTTTTGNTPTVPNATRDDRLERRTIPPFQRINQNGTRTETTIDDLPQRDNPEWKNTRRSRDESPTYDSPKYESKPVYNPPPSTPIIVMPSNPKSPKDN